MSVTAQRMPTCSLQRALNVVGEKWTFVILRDVFNGIVRFDDLHEHIGLARPVLAKRVATLVEQGLLERVPYREAGQRTRAQYALTAKGRDLYPVLLTLREWGDQYLADEATTLRVNRHSACGAVVHHVFRCENGHVIDDLGEIETMSSEA
jgi:DNA-binding HxlR family transcriptional regulator